MTANPVEADLLNESTRYPPEGTAERSADSANATAGGHAAMTEMGRGMSSSDERKL